MADYRYDPFLGSMAVSTITNELRKIPDSSPYNVRLLEVPLKESPSSLVVKLRDAILTEITSTGQTAIGLANIGWWQENDVLTVDNEQLQITALTQSSSTLSAAITTTGATSCAVASGAQFLIGNYIQIDSEIMLITNIATNTLTIARAQLDTTAATHTSGKPVTTLNRAVVTRGYNSTTAATHSAKEPCYGAAWSEVAAAPTAKQFWPDYTITVDGDGSWNTGTLRFNSADADKTVAVSYGGTGTLVDETTGEVQAGKVAFFAMNAAPPGYIKANGAIVSRAAYYKLFSKIGTTFGAGDGHSTFAVPDMRGYFARGWDDGRGIDSGRVLGSYQDGTLASHSHNVQNYATNDGSSPRVTCENTGGGGVWATVATTATGGTETRPKNTALLACIKY